MYQNREFENLSLRVSIVIPTINESAQIVDCINWLNVNDSRLLEIIVVDGRSEDDTVQLISQLGIAVFSTDPSRAIQMNEGARNAKGNVLYFVHADTRPPKSYLYDIENSIKQGYVHGCYRSKFDTSSLRMKFNAFFTRYRFLMFRGGDQSLFVLKSFFETTGGFDASQAMMEEYAWLRIARKQHRLRIIPKGCLISTRKYDKNSYFRINLINLYVFLLFYLNYPSDKIASIYKRMLN